MVVLLSTPLDLGRPPSDFFLGQLVVHNPEVGSLWNPRLCALWPLPFLGLLSVPEPWDQGRTSTDTRNRAGDPHQILTKLQRPQPSPVKGVMKLPYKTDPP